MGIEGAEGKALLGGINTVKYLELNEIKVHGEGKLKKVEEILLNLKRKRWR
jgi:hypothetical protein